MAIVVTKAATAIVVAKATVVTVESVRVAAPSRVPEVAWAPLRERPGLGLGYASRLETDEPEARGDDKCRYCNASNVFHAQFVPSELLNLRGVRTLDIPLQRQGDAYFRKSVVAEIAVGTPQKPIDSSARRTSTRAACRGDPISAELRRSCGEVSSYARRRSPRTASAPFVVGHSHPANRCRSWFCLRNLKSRCNFGAVRQVARIMSSGGRPGRSPLLRRASTDNGPDRPDVMRSLLFERPPASTAGFVSVGERRVLRRLHQNRSDSPATRSRVCPGHQCFGKDGGRW
jgi:hypothetical protein